MYQVKWTTPNDIYNGIFIIMLLSLWLSYYFSISFRFIERQKNEMDYLEIHLDTLKCRAQVGRKGGKQIVRVGGCNDEQDNISYGKMIHELMHSLG